MKKLIILGLLISLSSSQIQASSNHEKIESALLTTIVIVWGAFTTKIVYDFIKPNPMDGLIDAIDKENEFNKKRCEALRKDQDALNEFNKKRFEALEKKNEALKELNEKCCKALEKKKETKKLKNGLQSRNAPNFEAARLNAESLKHVAWINSTNQKTEQFILNTLGGAKKAQPYP